MADLLDAILDTLIPPSADGRMPGAGSLGLADAIRPQAQGDVVEAGLAVARAAGFFDLDLAGRTEVLRQIEASQPAFVPALYLPACIAYYQHPDVQSGLGLEPRPPHPKGYELEPGDFESLERVRARGKLYRETS